VHQDVLKKDYRYIRPRAKLQITHIYLQRPIRRYQKLLFRLLLNIKNANVGCWKRPWTELRHSGSIFSPIRSKATIKLRYISVNYRRLQLFLKLSGVVYRGNGKNPNKYQ